VVEYLSGLFKRMTIGENMNTVLLTGFAGFIGSQLLRDLLGKGYTVIGVENMSEGSDKNNFSDQEYDVEYGENFYPILADISDPKLFDYLEALSVKIDYIISNAAQSHVDRSWGQYETFIKTNITGQVNLAEIALKHKVKKFVYVNTDEVFAGSPQPFNEDTVFSPKNIYSSTKASADMLLLNYLEAFKLPLVITHGANSYGPRQKEKIIPLSIEKITKGERIPLYKTPAQRMYLHVSDHSEGIILAMEKGVVGERYCLAPSMENELYTHELIELICKKMGKKYSDFVDEVEDRLNYDLRYWMENKKAVKELGWNPSKNIEEEIESTIKWYRGV